MRINYIGSRANPERNIEIEAKDKEMELVEKILKEIGWSGEFAWFGSGDMNDGYASVDSRAEYDDFCRDFREARKALKQTVTRYQDKYDSQKIWMDTVDIDDLSSYTLEDDFEDMFSPDLFLDGNNHVIKVQLFRMEDDECTDDPIYERSFRSPYQD